MKQYYKYRLYVLMLKAQNFNKELVEKRCKVLKEKEVKSLREQLIAQLYEKSLIVEKIQQKYSYYQFIYYLLIITDNNFDDEFEVKNEGDIDILLKFVN